jgi:hypothetical protein
MDSQYNIQTKLEQIIYLLIKLYQNQSRIDTAMNLSAKILINQIKQHGIYDNIHDAEFKVYSQFGDDGIIQYLINNIEIPEKLHTFVEFGVENYLESNTRFLLYNNNWTGLVMDSSKENIDFILKDMICWRNELNAVCAFITRDNINDLLLQNNFSGEIGILSIDIDGNDYWVWEKINVINPIITIVEYNSNFGCKKAVTIPYDPDFSRYKAHYSGIYFGCSLKALCMLADKKGYYFVGSNSQGNNAYFVRKDKIGKIKILSPEEGYVKAKFRESVDEKGNLTFLSFDERLKLIKDLQLIDLTNQKTITVKETVE